MSLSVAIDHSDSSDSDSIPLPIPSLKKSKSASPYRKPPPLALSLPDPSVDPYESFDVSRILPNVLVSGKGVARNFEVLWGMGVRGVVDCNRNEGDVKAGGDSVGGVGVGGGVECGMEVNSPSKSWGVTNFTIDSSSAGRSPARIIKIITLNVTDESKSDIVGCLEPAFRFINELEPGASALVHCHSGMSRSCTIAIAYIMEVSSGARQKN